MNTSLRSFFKSLLTLAALCIALAGGAQSAHAHGLPHLPALPSLLTGDLATHQVECSTLCTQGVLTGGFDGRLDFVMTTMTPTEDPDVFLYVGTNTITTATGTLFGIDHGIWNVVTGEFVDLMTFSKATGSYAGKTGTFSISGVFDPVGGLGHSKYLATLIRKH